MAEPNTNLVRFYQRWVRNNFKSEEAGYEVGDYQDYVEIQGLGQDKQRIDRKVRDQDKLEYARQWELYKRGLEQTQAGTPLERWPQMSHGDVMRLKSFGIHTIQALCDTDDAGLLAIGHGARELQRRAKQFLEVDVPKSAEANARVRVEELGARVEALEAENLQLRAMLEDAYKMLDDEDPEQKDVSGDTVAAKPGKRPLTQAQRDALAKGRQKLAEKRAA